ncbi:MAG TPA: transcription antitermination factor NusB [Acidimicrobiales bacterium]
MTTAPGVAARQLAAEALVRIERDGAYANLAVSPLLERSGLDDRDRAFVTELVYGTTRMRRACDWLVDRFLPDPDRVDLSARTWLRLGAFQLHFLETPPHAAVGATVEAAPKKLKGLCNAVLRKVAGARPDTWPDPAIRLSQPDWIIERLAADLGEAEALDALEAMNVPATVTMRADGYVQDLASQWVADAVAAGAGERVLDVCSAPGGKATRLADDGAFVVAADVRPSRVGLVAGNARALDLGTDQLACVVADGTAAPFPQGSFDKVLLDAPCSGLGALRRRPDARWRIGADDVVALAALQRRLLDEAATLVRPGGELVYSVCTLTAAESVTIDEWLVGAHPEMVALDAPDAPWRPAGRGALLLPQDAGTDGMYLLRLRRSEGDAPS